MIKNIKDNLKRIIWGSEAAEGVPKSRFGGRQVVILASLAAVMVASGVIGWAVFIKKDPAAPVVAAECSSNTAGPLLEEARTLIDARKEVELRSVAEKIEKMPKFDQKPSCLYPVLAYYIAASDAPKARNYLNSLEKVYDPQLGFSPKLGTNVDKIEKLRSNVQFLERTAGEIKNNSFTAGEDPGQ